MTYWIGMDISKDEVAVCVMDDAKAVQHARFANTRTGFNSLHHYLKKRGAAGAAACLEATGTYGEAVATFLHARGYPVAVVNPLRIKRYAESQLRRNKTDKLDAAVIADFCRTQDAPLWTPPDAAWLELRALVRHLDDLIALHTQQQQRVQTEGSDTVRANLTQHIAYLDDQIAQVKQRIDDHIEQHPDLKRQHALLTSIPGIAERTSSRLLAEIRDITAFERVEQLVAYAGLNPKQRTSGKYRGQVKISKLGNAQLRTALYLPGRTAKRFNPLVQGLVTRMTAQGYCPNAITVAVMRKLLHYVYGVLKSGHPFDPHYLSRQAIAA